MRAKWLAAGAAIVALFGSAAQASCWSADEMAAATVRDLQSKLMVAALRCQVSRNDITADYNRFVAANRTTIAAMNDRLKAHFIRGDGAVAGQTSYDRFTTTLANFYGAGASGAEHCFAAAGIAREAAMMAGSLEGLLLLAGREGIATAVPDGVCAARAASVTMAAAGAPALAAPVQQAAVVEEQEESVSLADALAPTMGYAFAEAPGGDAAPVQVAAVQR